MSLGLFIAFVSVFAPLIIWALKNEDRLIDLEDKIIEVIRDSRAQAKREKNIHIVEGSANQVKVKRTEINRKECNFVA